MICNRARMAEFIGVSTPTIDAMVKAGAPYLARPRDGAGQWQFDSAAFINWTVAQAAAKDPIGHRTKVAQAREADAKASLREMELQAQLRSLVHVDDLLEIVEGAFAISRHHLSAPFNEALAAKLAAEPDANACLLLLKDAVNAGLEAASNAAELAAHDVPAETQDT